MGFFSSLFDSNSSMSETEAKNIIRGYYHGNRNSNFSELLKACKVLARAGKLFIDADHDRPSCIGAYYIYINENGLYEHIFSGNQVRANNGMTLGQQDCNLTVMPVNAINCNIIDFSA